MNMQYRLEFPQTILERRIMIKGGLGIEYDYLPILYPVGMPQSMMMDYSNFLGRGPTCLYITGFCPIYYVYVGESFEWWMDQHIKMLTNDLYEIDQKDGSITTWLNVPSIYDKYIHALKVKADQAKIEEAYAMGHQEFPTTSCTVKDGFIVCL